MTWTAWPRFRAIGCGLSILVGGSTAFCGISAVAAGSATQASLRVASLVASGSIPHPIDLPTGPVASAASCPNPPELSSPLPSGASISAPSIVPTGTSSVIAANETYDLSGTCEYTITIASTSNGASPDGGSVTFVGSGSDFYYPTGVDDSIDFTYRSQGCETSAEIVSAFGLAVAEQELDSGYCNTDASEVWGYASAIDTDEVQAASVQESVFSKWFQSNEDGDIFFGQFQECMENPIGQHANYVCTNDNYGPLF